MQTRFDKWTEGIPKKRVRCEKFSVEFSVTRPLVQHVRRARVDPVSRLWMLCSEHRFKRKYLNAIHADDEG